jgi:hypothetical protein
VSETPPGQPLADAFSEATAGERGLHEDELLEAWMAALPAIGEAGDLAAETHRGQRAFVDFTPHDELPADERRSQLADLLVVTYTSTNPPDLRVCLLQARRRPGPLPAVAGDVPLARARFNVYHWDLLHRRPAIAPAGNVTPPRRILADARLPSLGGSLVFHRPDPEAWQLSFASAEVTHPWGEWPPAKRPRRTVRFPDVTAWRRRSGYRETLTAAGVADLGELLAEGVVGSPVQLPPARESDRLTASWLAAVLAATVRKREAGEAELAADLHERLTDALASAGLVDADSRVGAPHVAIVRARR